MNNIQQGEFKIASIKSFVRKGGVVIEGGKPAIKHVLSCFMRGNYSKIVGNPTKCDDTSKRLLQSSEQGIKEKLKDVLAKSPQTAKIFTEKERPDEEANRFAGGLIGMFLAQRENTVAEELLESFIKAIDESGFYYNFYGFDYDALGTPMFDRNLIILPVPNTHDNRYVMDMPGLREKDIKKIASFFEFEQPITSACIFLELIPKSEQIKLDWTDIANVFFKIPELKQRTPFPLMYRPFEPFSTWLHSSKFKIEINLSSSSINLQRGKTQGTIFTAPIHRDRINDENLPTLMLSITDQHPESVLRGMQYTQGERAFQLENFRHQIINAFAPFSLKPTLVVDNQNRTEPPSPFSRTPNVHPAPMLRIIKNTSSFYDFDDWMNKILANTSSKVLLFSEAHSAETQNLWILKGLLPTFKKMGVGEIFSEHLPVDFNKELVYSNSIGTSIEEAIGEKLFNLTGIGKPQINVLQMFRNEGIKVWAAGPNLEFINQYNKYNQEFLEEVCKKTGINLSRATPLVRCIMEEIFTCLPGVGTSITETLNSIQTGLLKTSLSISLPEELSKKVLWCGRVHISSHYGVPKSFPHEDFLRIALVDAQSAEYFSSNGSIAEILWNELLPMAKDDVLAQQKIYSMAKKSGRLDKLFVTQLPTSKSSFADWVIYMPENKDDFIRI